MASTARIEPRRNNAGPRVLVVYRFKRNTADGGSAYERMVLDGISDFCGVDGHAIVLSGNRLKRYVALPLEALRFRRVVSDPSEYGLLIETMDASLMPVKRPQPRIVIVHHVGFSRDRLYALFERGLIRRLKAADCIVTVSEYWKAELTRMGFRNVRLIYNAFSIPDFDFETDELSRFLDRYQFGTKPIIYIGNHGLHKGTAQVAQCLAGMDVQIVASGDSSSPIPGVRTLRLHRRDYLRLLKCSMLAVTMSQFEEGWCRTAHEALLCGTPVIGSGRGGMRELLEGARQEICEDFRDLRARVSMLLQEPAARQARADAGLAFARQFDIERLRRDWVQLVTEMRA